VIPTPVATASPVEALFPEVRTEGLSGVALKSATAANAARAEIRQVLGGYQLVLRAVIKLAGGADGLARLLESREDARQVLAAAGIWQHEAFVRWADEKRLADEKAARNARNINDLYDLDYKHDPRWLAAYQRGDTAEANRLAQVINAEIAERQEAARKSSMWFRDETGVPVTPYHPQRTLGAKPWESFPDHQPEGLAQREAELAGTASLRPGPSPEQVAEEVARADAVSLRSEPASPPAGQPGPSGSDSGPCPATGGEHDTDTPDQKYCYKCGASLRAPELAAASILQAGPPDNAATPVDPRST